LATKNMPMITEALPMPKVSGVRLEPVAGRSVGELAPAAAPTELGAADAVAAGLDGTGGSAATEGAVGVGTVTAGGVVVVELTSGTGVASAGACGAGSVMIGGASVTGGAVVSVVEVCEQGTVASVNEE
jgi:hypothetical protein